MALTPEQMEWLGRDGAVAFGLTSGQVRMLRLALQWDAFSFQQIAVEIGLSRAAVSKSLRDLARRGIIALYRDGDNPTRSLHRADPGVALRPLLDRPPQQAAAG
jgi:DNA-binding MarR family transcriptional regulator